jgi:hypothetical protein
MGPPPRSSGPDAASWVGVTASGRPSGQAHTVISDWAAKDRRAPRKPGARPSINERVVTPPAIRLSERRSPTPRHRTRRRTWRKVNTTEECSRWAPSWSTAPSWFFAGRGDDRRVHQPCLQPRSRVQPRTAQKKSSVTAVTPHEVSVPQNPGRCDSCKLLGRSTRSIESSSQCLAFLGLRRCRHGAPPSLRARKRQGVTS